MTGTALWATVIIGSLGCYLLKLAGLSVPAAWVEQPWVARVVDFVPAALLAALVAVQAMASGNDLALDGRLVGLAVAAIALALRAPFIVVLVLAGAAGALVHALAGGPWKLTRRTTTNCFSAPCSDCSHFCAVAVTISPR
jgi:branched-subunit amino acid transport protein